MNPPTPAKTGMAPDLGDMNREDFRRFGHEFVDWIADYFERIVLPLRPAWKIISKSEGANDGLVSLTSQKWTDNIAAADGTTKPVEHVDFGFPADHLNVCGWWDPAEPEKAAEYEAKVKEVYLQAANSGIA